MVALGQPYVRAKLQAALANVEFSEFVDEVRRAVKACEVFLLIPLYRLSYGVSDPSVAQIQR